LNGRPKLLQKIHKFVTPRCKNESIKNREYYPEFEAKFENPSDTE
jgi:hypothetical protein